MTDIFAVPSSLVDTAESGWPAIADQEAVDYDPDTDTYRASFDPTEESVAMAVVFTVAIVSETPPTELPPLYYACDPAGLEAVAEPAVRGPSNGKSVSFTFDDYAVTVRSYGMIEVRPGGASAAASDDG